MNDVFGKSTGFLAVSAGEETVASITKKAESASADDIVLLEIDVKDPVKRSPVSASGTYGASPNQYVLPEQVRPTESRLFEIDHVVGGRSGIERVCIGHLASLSAVNRNY